MIDYDRLDTLAAGLMKKRKAHAYRERGFIYHHCKRTAVGVIALRRLVTDDDSHDDALRIAAMFHDIGKGIEPHDRSGAALAREMLKGELPDALLEEVAYLIGAHRTYAIEDIWANLLQDADIMDHYGAVEVGLSFQYGIATEGGMEATLDWYLSGGYDATADRMMDAMHFDASRRIQAEKIAYARDFSQRLRVELSGDYVAPPKPDETRQE